MLNNDFQIQKRKPLASEIILTILDTVEKCKDTEFVFVNHGMYATGWDRWIKIYIRNSHTNILTRIAEYTEIKGQEYGAIHGILQEYFSNNPIIKKIQQHWGEEYNYHIKDYGIQESSGKYSITCRNHPFIFSKYRTTSKEKAEIIVDFLETTEHIRISR